MQTKACARCKQELAVDNFYISKNGKINSYCKKCDKERKQGQKSIEPPADLNFYKICSCCGKEKLATEFHKHSRRKDGLSTQCKECDKIQQAQYKEKYKDNEQPETKMCKVCKQTKPASEFTFSSRSADQLGQWCKSCCKEFTAQRKQNIAENKETLPENYTKVCNICHKTKPADEYYKSSYTWDGLQYTCKGCEKREERRIYGINRSREVIEKQCKICGATFKAARNGSERCEQCKQHTIPEQIFIKMLKEQNVKYDTEFRVKDYWYDFYLPKFNILIDISPSSTHSTVGREGIFEPKNKNYHLERRKIANNEGYSYINIWDWDKPKEILNAIIKHKLKIEQHQNVLLHYCKNKLDSYGWGNYDSIIHKLSKPNLDEKQMISEGWLPVYDDGQVLSY